jgi:steroid delta-isomerase-like uncharacterized protein
MTEQERNKFVVLRDYVEVWNQGKMEVAREIVSPDFQDHPPTRFFDVGRSGPESLIEAASSFRKGMPDLHDAVQQMVAEGDMVAYLGRISGTHRGEMFGFAPTGKRASVWGINFFRFENDKIVERWGQFDVLGMMQQFGLAPGGHEADPSEMGTNTEHELPVASRVSAETLEANKRLYTRMVEEVVNGGRMDVVPELFSPAYVDHTSPPGAPEGLDGVKAVFGMFRTAFPDVHFTIEHLLAEGDVVATHVTGRGTNDGPFMGNPPSGKPATWRSTGFFRVEDGKIIEHWGIPDLLGLMMQIGLIPPPGTPRSREVEAH